MLTHPTLDILRELGLHGMAKGFQDLAAQAEARALDHGEWLAILLDHEATLRRQKRFEARARAARLRHDAQVEDTDFRAERCLDRTLFLKLATCDWIRKRHGLLLTGPAGVAAGSSWPGPPGGRTGRAGKAAGCTPSTGLCCGALGRGRSTPS